ncbi:MAG: hypothetical protein QNJ72_37835 [Pleurocapsa sp. MO_226.B13]|nr:hypothetical protein [Pleurocapsa sp. MO_226.B13]
MLKQNNLKLFLATLIAIAIANNLDLATLASTSLQAKIDRQSAIAPSLNNTLLSLENQSEFDVSSSFLFQFYSCDRPTITLKSKPQRELQRPEKFCLTFYRTFGKVNITNNKTIVR